MSRGPIPDKAADRPTVPEVLLLAAAYYDKPGNSMGGSLHVALEDGNLDDGNLEFCRGWAAKHQDEDGITLANVLLQLTRTQRVRLYAQWPYTPDR
jgi:hypothetical protein